MHSRDDRAADSKTGVQNVQKRKPGNGNPEVPTVGHGCTGMSFGRSPAVDRQEMISLLRLAVMASKN